MFNVPNQLTTARLILSIALFVLIELGNRQQIPSYYLAAMVLFIIAAGTDWLDGYWARKYGQVTTLGRILDPFVDKVIICGTFILLAALPASGLTAWMAVVVVARELLVTALRVLGRRRQRLLGRVIGQAQDGGAVPCGGVEPVSTELRRGAAAQLGDDGSGHRRLGAVVLTVYSGVEYVIAAVRLLRR